MISNPEAYLLMKIAKSSSPISMKALSPEDQNLVHAMRSMEPKLVYFANLNNDLVITDAGRHALQLWEQANREAAQAAIRSRQEQASQTEKERKTARRSWLQALLGVVGPWLLGWLSSVLGTPVDFWNWVKSLFSRQ